MKIERYLGQKQTKNIRTQKSASPPGAPRFCPGGVNFGTRRGQIKCQIERDHHLERVGGFDQKSNLQGWLCRERECSDISA